MVTCVGCSVLQIRVEEWSSHTIPFCFHHPCMIPCYPYTDSNMTCHSEREQCHWGPLQACPLRNFQVGNIIPQWQPPASAVWAACTQAAIPSPITPTPVPPHSPNPSFSRKLPLSLPYHFCIVNLLVVDSQSRCCHSCIFFQFLHFALWLGHLSFLVPFHKLVQQNRP